MIYLKKILLLIDIPLNPRLHQQLEELLTSRELNVNVMESNTRRLMCSSHGGSKNLINILVTICGWAQGIIRLRFM